MAPKIFVAAGTLLVAVLVSLRPSMWLVGAAVLYRAGRAGGAGQGIGEREMIKLDGAVQQVLMVLYGVFSLFCRGVHPTALIACGLLTFLYVEARRNQERASVRLTWATVAFTWALMLWRGLHPIQGLTVIESIKPFEWN